jgi:hypothetical protein
MIICLFKRWLFLIKPEDLFDLSGFGSAITKAKHAVNIMSLDILDESLPVWGFPIRKRKIKINKNHPVILTVSKCLENPSEVCIISQMLSKFMH